MDRPTDAVVAATAADIPLHGDVDIGIGRFGVAVQESYRAHDLSRLTIAALRHLFVDPGFLYRLALGVSGQTFDGRDLLSGHCGDRKAAGPDCSPPHMD